MDLSNVVIEDDAEEELNAMLNRARKLQQLEENKEMTEGDSALKVSIIKSGCHLTILLIFSSFFLVFIEHSSLDVFQLMVFVAA